MLTSTRHIHLHVMSADLCSPAMKNTKHYNSFHPKRGFFISLSDVQEWLEAEPSYFATVSLLVDTITSREVSALERWRTGCRRSSTMVLC